ncbi:SGNH/GDSL hydrolase family protein [Blautia segnis]|uniref:SGNH/GDSL hydrolase family protein n=1 Tax=Blautia segnis TaxID=2763030 RepID=A0A8I0AGV8_9FIRM|nr:SGNH/GDSL hydrolase family protein [Blautia segnis]MBC5650129.1 SGNH/GDSL hydrolase family protein [Blautia segnis]
MKRKAFIMAMVMCMMGSAVGTTGMTVYAEENTAESEESVETEESTESEEGTETEASVETSTEAGDTLAEGQVLLPASEAVFTEGEGVGPNNEKEPTSYDEEVGMIRAAAQGTEIVYTVPEGAEGTYDMYLTVSKVLAAFSSQPFTFTINDGETFSVPVDLQVPADSPASYTEDGEYDEGTLTDSGRFLIKQSLELKAGDTIKVTCAFGCKAPTLKGMVFPYVGDVLLAPAGSEVPTGYDNTVKTVPEADPSDPLAGLNIIWLGSSVTYGAQAGGHYSMVDAIQDNHPGTVCEKYAISATTLVNEKEDSYVGRMKLISKDETPDLFVVQLSTNDATTGKPMGEVTDSTDPADFDDTTIAGAIETIISYVKETFGCPVVFYTGTYAEKENYEEMVDLLLQIQEKWGIGVVDMFHNEDMTAIYGTDLYNEYMHDEVHPFRKGYVEWWTPVIEEYLTEFLGENK